MVRIGATWLVVMTGLVSTAASFFGGLLMYIEGLKVLEDAVEEIGTSELHSLAGKLDTRVLESEKRCLFGNDLLSLETGRLFDSRETLAMWVRVAGSSQMAFSELGLGGVGFVGMSSKDTPVYNNSHFYTVFNSERTRPDGKGTMLERINCHLEPAQEGCAYPCMMCDLLNYTRPYNPIRHVYNFTTGVIKTVVKRKRDLKIQPGKGFWLGPFQWVGSDETPYDYIFRFVASPRLSSPIFSADADMFAYVFMPMKRLREVVEQVEGKHSRVVVIQTMGTNRVLAARGLRMLDQEQCRMQSFQSCTLTINHIVETDYRNTIIAVNKTREKVFTKFNGIWVSKERIFRNDDGASVIVDPGFNSLYVVWLRPVSSIKDKMNSALFVFVGFVAGVFAFDVLVGACEILLVAKPLKLLSSVALCIEALRLNEATALLEDRSVPIEEVYRLHRGFEFVIASLQEYKSYLPQSLFVEEDDEDEEAGKSTHRNTNESGSATEASSASLRNPNAAVTRVGLQKCDVASTLIRLASPTGSPVQAQSAYADNIAIIEGTIGPLRGALHPYLAGDCTTLLVTFSTASSLEKALTAACQMAARMPVGYGVTACSLITLTIT